MFSHRVKHGMAADHNSSSAADPCPSKISPHFVKVSGHLPQAMLCMSAPTELREREVAFVVSSRKQSSVQNLISPQLLVKPLMVT
jgi:hypothetical protein